MHLCRDYMPSLTQLLGRYGLTLSLVAEGAVIPGSFWGDAEAGLRGNCLYVRADTPLHSALHETGHFVCLDDSRRGSLDTDAGGDDLEEAAVCFLQIVLADEFANVGRSALCEDMDAWGYSFRLGSAARWFAEDADDARLWLLRHDLINTVLRSTWRVRH